MYIVITVVSNALCHTCMVVTACMLVGASLHVCLQHNQAWHDLSLSSDVDTLLL